MKTQYPIMKHVFIERSCPNNITIPIHLSIFLSSYTVTCDKSLLKHLRMWMITF